MYVLRFLGGASIEGPEGPVVGPAAQPRRLAFLAFLAAARGQPFSRDKLIGVLWPESTPESARHAVRDSIYVLNHVLDDAPIEVVGDALRIDPARCASDVAAFQTAIESGDLEQAVELYGGGFLDGLFLKGALEFEEWVREERDRYSRAYAQALEELAERASLHGDHLQAASWWRDLVAHDPCSDRTVTRLMEALAAAGDRAEALRQADAYAVLMRETFDAAPDETVMELVGRLREEPAKRTRTGGAETVLKPRGDTAAWISRRRWSSAAVVAVILGFAAWYIGLKDDGPGPERAPGIPAVRSIAVLPFNVQGENIEFLREGMVDLLSRNVDIFSGVRAVPSRTVLARWHETGTNGPTDLARALDVARSIGAHYAVTGSVLARQNELLIRGEVFDLQGSTKLGDAVAEGSPDSLLMIVDRLSLGLLSPLLIPSTGGRRWPGLASVTTSSPAALRAFLEGERLFRAAEYQSAIEAYERAVDTDSTFALAHYRLADAFGWTTGSRDSRDSARLAARYADRLPEREARLMEAMHFAQEGLNLEWIETLREAIRRHPLDAEAWYWLGEAYFHVGGEMLIRPWEFVETFERAITLDPSFAPAYEHLIDESFLHEPDSVRASALIERQKSAGGVHEISGAAFGLAFGDPAMQEEVRAKLRDLSPFELRGLATNNLSHPRFLGIRETVLRAALDRTPENWDRTLSVYLLWTLFARGHVAEAIEFSDVPAISRDKATALYKARVYGYAIPDQVIEAALAEEPTQDPVDDIDSLLANIPAIFERGADAADRGAWSDHTRARDTLRALFTTSSPGDARDTLWVQGLVDALDGYAAWRRGDHKAALTLLRRAQVRTRGGNPIDRDPLFERNGVIRAWLAKLLVEMGRPQEALLFYESLGPGWPTGQDPMIYFQLGRVRDQLGDWEGARYAYELAAVAWQDTDPELQRMVEETRQAIIRLEGLRSE
jgi:DNA-binding SARP family transcriptional activator/TolB-like protein